MTGCAAATALVVGLLVGLTLGLAVGVMIFLAFEGREAPAPAEQKDRQT